MYKLIAQKLGFTEQQISAVISLLKEGATIPFIARYRTQAAHRRLLGRYHARGYLSALQAAP